MIVLLCDGRRLKKKNKNKKRQKQHTWLSTILTSRAVLMESMSNYDYVSYLCRWEGEWRRKKNVNPNFVFRVKDMTCDLKHVGTKTTAAEFVFKKKMISLIGNGNYSNVGQCLITGWS